MRHVGRRARYAGGVATLALLIAGQATAAGANGHEASGGRAAVSAVKVSQPVEVMTYDIRDLLADGTFEGSGDISPWSKRAPKEAALIRKAKPDVVAIQEGASYVGTSKTRRQVDSLRHAIGDKYRVAHTEIRAPHPHSFRTGDYIIFNSATLTPVGRGAYFTVGDSKYAVYEEFASRMTGVKFLLVSTHLLVGLGHSADLTREAETTKMLTTAGAVARHRHIPVIYAGNFNSAGASVGAGEAMKRSGARDALTVAPRRTNATINSDNEYLRAPPHDSVDIDHIYVPSGITITSAGVVVSLRNGKFVGVIPSDHNPVVAQLRVS